MAKGDNYTDMVEVADDANTDIQPAAGQEVELHNIGWSGAGNDAPVVIIYKKDGAGSRQMLDQKTWPSLGWNYSYVPGIWEIDNGDYINVENKSGATIYIWWTGRETHVAD